MGIISTENIFYVNTNPSWHGLLPCKGEDVVDVLATSDDDGFVMETYNVRSKDIEMQHMIELALPIYQETTMDRCIKEMVETKVFSWVKTANYEAGKGKKIPFYQAVQTVLHLAVALGTVNEAVTMNIDDIFECKAFSKT